MNTAQQFDEQIATCRNVFEKKTQDYGTSWRVLRPKSLTSAPGIDAGYNDIVNYAIFALIKLSEQK